MNDKLTKEILSVVLDCDVFNIEYVQDNKMTIVIRGEGYRHYNLDTLGIIFKEWCYRQDYYIKSGRNSDNSIDKVCDEYETDVYQLVFDGEPREKLVANIGGDSELRAIVKTTKWVAKEKKLY